MNNVAKEITREYRLDFNNGETHWDDPIPPEVTSRLLGRRVTCIISRTSLLAWSLMMDVREVEVADVTADGWMRIEVSRGPEAGLRETRRGIVRGLCLAARNGLAVALLVKGPCPRGRIHVLKGTADLSPRSRLLPNSPLRRGFTGETASISFNDRLATFATVTICASTHPTVSSPSSA